MAEAKKDPENYRKMSEPFDNAEEAHKALGDFYKELGELRKKHKIRDLLVVTYGAMISDGEETEYMNSMSYGNSLNTIAMAAFSYGKEKEAHTERIAKLLVNKKP